MEYAVYRLLDTIKISSPENREYATGFMTDFEKAEAIAGVMNR